MPITQFDLNGQKISTSTDLATRIQMANQDMQKTLGQGLKINQSFRTFQQQQDLYNKLSPKGAAVAKPGTSFHEKGEAVDVTNYKEAQPFLKRYGLANDVKGDAGHFSYGETNKQMAQSFADNVETARKQGASDTDILNTLSQKYPQFAKNVQTARGQKAGDTDILNFLAVKFSGRVPQVQSNPIKDNGSQVANQGGGQGQSPIESLFGGVNTAIGAVKKAADWTGIPNLIGNVVGATGQLVGGVVGGLAETVNQTGKFLGGGEFNTDKIVKSAQDISQKTGQFGKQIGTEGAENAPLMAVGKIPSALIAGSQLYQGGKDLIKGNYEQAVPELALGALGAYGVKSSKGLIFNEPIGKVADMTLGSGKKGVDELVNTITQGKIADVTKAKQALSSFDTTGIKTFQDFQPAITTRIKNLAEGQDKLLSNDTSLYKPNQLNIVSEVGNVKVKTNFVQTAIEDLQNHYTLAADAVKAEKFNQYLAKFKKEGLSAKEVNDIARTYGQEFSQKSFGITGLPKSGVSAAKAENIRTGVKTTARNILPEEAKNASVELDTQMSNLYRLRDLTSKMAERVNRAQAKLETPGLIEKITNKLVGVVDTVSMGTVKGFVKNIIAKFGKGEQSLSSLELEANLSKNLKMLDKLNAATKESDILAALDDIIKANGPKITEPAMIIDKTLLTGKNHGEIIKQAKDLGLDTSKVNRDKQGKFITTEGTLINRQQALKDFGVNHSHQLNKQQPDFSNILGLSKMKSKLGNTTTGALIGTGVAAGAGTLLAPVINNAIKGKTQGSQIIPNQDIKTEMPADKKEIDTNKLLKVIKWEESRGQTNPYSFHQSSGGSVGEALGAYQVTEGELKTYSKRYLGREVTPEEFLKNTKLQDEYMTKKIKYMQDNMGLPLEEIIGAHRGGINGRKNPKYQAYINEALGHYNSSSF